MTANARIPDSGLLIPDADCGAKRHYSVCGRVEALRWRSSRASICAEQEHLFAAEPVGFPPGSVSWNRTRFRVASAIFERSVEMTVAISCSHPWSVLQEQDDGLAVGRQLDRSRHGRLRDDTLRKPSSWCTGGP